jgi:hypothetical protein
VIRDISRIKYLKAIKNKIISYSWATVVLLKTIELTS